MARYKFCFWLNGDKDDELLVAETVDELKAHRSFSSVIRDGIMIVSELRQGRVDTLLRLYPWVKDAIADMLPPPPAPPTPQSFDMDELLRRLEVYMEQGRGAHIPDSRDSGFPAFAPVMKPSKLQKAIAMPVLDDDDEPAPFTMTIKKPSTLNGGNLLAGVLGLD